jgi:hypothetical protein
MNWPPGRRTCGEYLVWEIRGHVEIRITDLAQGQNAVVSGIFFG